MSLQKTLSDLAVKINAEIRGDKNCIITGIATLQDAKPGHISFLSNAKYRQFLKTTHASAIVISPSYLDFCQTNALIVDDPQYAYAILANEFADIPSQQPGIHPSAVIGQNCQIASSVAIGANTVIDDNVSIGENTQIAANCAIGKGCKIGANCQLWSNVTIYYGVKVGDNVLLHSGVVLGSDGFSYANHDNAWHKIQQLGSVIIGDDVEIGANTTIDRGALSNTVIGKGVKLDNLIQVAHNVQIGENTAIAGCVGIAGSTKIGKNCMIGGAAGIGGHLDITDNVIITGMAMISNSIKEPGVYSSGTGFLKNRDWQKNVVRFRHLDEIAKKMQMLEDRLELLEAQADEKD